MQSRKNGGKLPPKDASFGSISPAISFAKNKNDINLSQESTLTSGSYNQEHQRSRGELAYVQQNNHAHKHPYNSEDNPPYFNTQDVVLQNAIKSTKEVSE